MVRATLIMQLCEYFIEGMAREGCIGSEAAHLIAASVQRLDESNGPFLGSVPDEVSRGSVAFWVFRSDMR